MLDLLLNQAKVPSEAAKGQLKQDIAALVCNAFKRDGYFVDIGAADGIYSSNTAMLEGVFGWDGICAEANPHFQAHLRANRRCAVDDRCVWTTTGETLSFHYAHDTLLSTLSDFVSTTSFGFICVEHNYAANREPIKTLLTRKGYRRIWTQLSQWDDWYIPDGPSVASKPQGV